MKRLDFWGSMLVVSKESTLNFLGEHRCADRIKPRILVRSKTTQHALADALLRPILCVLIQQGSEGKGKLQFGSMSN